MEPTEGGGQGGPGRRILLDRARMWDVDHPAPVAGDFLYLSKEGFISRSRRAVVVPVDPNSRMDKSSALLYSVLIHDAVSNIVSEISQKRVFFRDETHVKSHHLEGEEHISQVSGGWVNIGQRYQLKSSLLLFVFSSYSCRPTLVPAPPSSMSL